MEKYCTVRIKNIKNCDMENIAKIMLFKALK